MKQYKDYNQDALKKIGEDLYSRAKSGNTSWGSPISDTSFWSGLGISSRGGRGDFAMAGFKHMQELGRQGQGSFDVIQKRIDYETNPANQRDDSKRSTKFQSAVKANSERRIDDYKQGQGYYDLLEGKEVGETKDTTGTSDTEDAADTASGEVKSDALKSSSVFGTTERRLMPSYWRNRAMKNIKY